MAINYEEGMRFSHGNFEYKVVDSERCLLDVCGLANVNNSESEITIPSRACFEGVDYKVVGIKSGAFKRNESLVSVTIEEGLKKIKRNAFKGCRRLERVNIPDSVSKLGQSAFEGCVSLKAFEIGIGVTRLPYKLLGGCLSIRKMFIPKHVVGIDGFFVGGNLLDEIEVDPDNEFYTSYDGCLFTKDRTVLLEIPGKRKTIRLPKEMQGFNYYGGLSRSGIEDFEVDPENNKFCSVDGVIYDKRVKTLLACPDGRVRPLIVPEGVKSVVVKAFSGCSKLEKVVLPDSLREIGNDGFSRNFGLKEIEFPGYMTDICEECLAYCKNLTTVTFRESKVKSRTKEFGWGMFKGDGKLESARIPEGITGLSYTFQFCESLKEVILPESLKTIGNESFYGCKSLESITLPSGLQSIGDRAFQLCKSIKEIVIPKSVKQIGMMAFEGCKSLKSITVDKDNEKYTSVDGVLYSKDMKHLIVYPNGKEGKIFIPASVTGADLTGKPLLREIEVAEDNKHYCSQNGMLYNKNLTKLLACPGGYDRELIFPESLVSIGYKAFGRCNNIKEVIFPKSVYDFDGFVFADSKNLESVVFEGKISRIESNMFYGCKSMKRVRFADRTSPCLAELEQMNLSKGREYPQSGLFDTDYELFVIKITKG